MPIALSISHEDKLVVGVAEGEISRENIDGYLSAIIAAKAMPYRKLFDLTFAPLSLGAGDLKALGRRVAEQAKHGPVGPVAIVVASELALEMATIFDKQSPADRPLRIFRDVAAARDWLDKAASPKAAG